MGHGAIPNEIPLPRPYLAGDSRTCESTSPSVSYPAAPLSNTDPIYRYRPTSSPLASLVSELVRNVSPDAILLPTVHYGFNEHHMDYPGTVAIPGQDFINYAPPTSVSAS